MSEWLNAFKLFTDGRAYIHRDYILDYYDVIKLTAGKNILPVPFSVVKTFLEIKILKLCHFCIQHTTKGQNQVSFELEFSL